MFIRPHTATWRNANSVQSKVELQQEQKKRCKMAIVIAHKRGKIYLSISALLCHCHLFVFRFFSTKLIFLPAFHAYSTPPSPYIDSPGWRLAVQRAIYPHVKQKNFISLIQYCTVASALNYTALCCSASVPRRCPSVYRVSRLIIKSMRTHALSPVDWSTTLAIPSRTLLPAIRSLFSSFPDLLPIRFLVLSSGVVSSSARCGTPKSAPVVVQAPSVPLRDDRRRRRILIRRLTLGSIERSGGKSIATVYLSLSLSSLRLYTFHSS